MFVNRPVSNAELAETLIAEILRFRKFLFMILEIRNLVCKGAFAFYETKSVGQILTQSPPWPRPCKTRETNYTC